MTSCWGALRNSKEQAGDTLVILFSVKVPRQILEKLSGNSTSQCPVYLSPSVSPVIFSSIFPCLIYDAKSFFQASYDFHCSKKKSYFINFLPVAPRYELTCRLKKKHALRVNPHSSQHTVLGLVQPPLGSRTCISVLGFWVGECAFKVLDLSVTSTC